MGGHDREGGGVERERGGRVEAPIQKGKGKEEEKKKSEERESDRKRVITRKKVVTPTQEG
jgi:hypothetical protein